ncbi:MAG: thiolase family protein [Polymorphobacter sp.]
MSPQPIAFMPYGGWWSTPFVRWQGPLAELHSLRFAAWTGARALLRRGIDPAALDFGVLGFTVPQKGSFYGLPWLAAELGAAQLPGPTIMQACATSARCLQVAATEIAGGGATAALVVACDRVSNGPHLYYPCPGSPGGSGDAEDWVLDNFVRDPWAGCAMVQTAENVAAKWGITREAQDDLVLMRLAQYHAAVAAGFHAGFMERDIPDQRMGAACTTLDGDIGVQPLNAEKVRGLKPVHPGGIVTFAGQTHPADGNAGAIVATRKAARGLSGRPEIEIAIRGFGTARVERAMMPAAPVPAAARALAMAGVAIGDIDAVTSHNPFAVNDIVFAHETGFALERMNINGCSLVFGHPQGPTGLRCTIELIETLAARGGGIGLFQGCAAGDTAMAVVVEVRDAG